MPDGEHRADCGKPRCSRKTAPAALLFVMVGAAFLGATACDLQREERPGPAPSAPVARSPGLVYAEQACAECHAVEAGRTQSPDPKAPTFETIANTPGVTRMGLSALLHTSHRTMPNLIVDPNRIDDLSAYLDTLRK
jgi:mono/diheme cytochrome c family protein